MEISIYWIFTLAKNYGIDWAFDVSDNHLHICKVALDHAEHLAISYIRICNTPLIVRLPWLIKKNPHHICFPGRVKHRYELVLFGNKHHAMMLIKVYATILCQYPHLPVVYFGFAWYLQHGTADSVIMLFQCISTSAACVIKCHSQVWMAVGYLCL